MCKAKSSAVPDIVSTYMRSACVRAANPLAEFNPCTGLVWSTYIPHRAVMGLE